MLSAESEFSYQPGAKPRVCTHEKEPRAEGPSHRSLGRPRRERGWATLSSQALLLSLSALKVPDHESNHGFEQRTARVVVFVRAGPD